MDPLVPQPCNEPLASRFVGKVCTRGTPCQLFRTVTGCAQELKSGDDEGHFLVNHTTSNVCVCVCVSSSERVCGILAPGLQISVGIQSKYSHRQLSPSSGIFSHHKLLHSKVNHVLWMFGTVKTPKGNRTSGCRQKYQSLCAAAQATNRQLTAYGLFTFQQQNAT
jgi:hypothetical protein